MKKHRLSFIAFLLIGSFALSSHAQETTNKNLEDFLNSLEGAKITHTPLDSLHQDAYTIMLPQYVDQESKTGPQFYQRMYLTHIADSLPIVMVTEGYSAQRNYISEPAKLLHCNQIIVEHRYFEESVPDSMDWSQLTTANAAADHHHVFETFSQYYKGKWISTGISKGGQTSIFYKYYYPEDMHISIPYVAPLNVEQEDVRINWFLRHVGEEEDNKKILNYQKLMLTHFDSIFPLFQSYATHFNDKYTINDTACYEFMVLEVPFSYYQWGSYPIDSLPTIYESASQMIKPMWALGLVNFYFQSTLDGLMPFMVQAYRELGYYNYDLGDLQPYLRKIKNSSNIAFVPEELRFEYDDEIMKKIYDFIHNKGDRMVFVYGELDPWSSTSVNPDSRTNALKMVLEGGSHTTRIRHFSNDEQAMILRTINNWLNED